ncbi:hypothetical protein COLO4_22353 [Corchorus olitorius]|uniref:Uncharacterized protein n=1 Tax=Corchorus olitorius TaxID=93759 RepID=A0A1R3IMQ7_9ROSI|nr:hypothetical protein COLO4_22353 [Corchorus olitorius]
MEVVDVYLVKKNGEKFSGFLEWERKFSAFLKWERFSWLKKKWVIEPKFQRGTWFQWDVDRRPRMLLNWAIELNFACWI